MNTLALIDASLLWSYGIYIFVLTVKNWNNPKKAPRFKYSEIVYSIAFLINGFLMLTIFNGQGLSDEKETLLYGIILIAYLIVLVWLWIFNILFTYLRVRKHPELLKDTALLPRNYDLFLAQLDKKYRENVRNEDIIKDLSRKALHLVLLGVVLGFHEISFLIQPLLNDWGLTPIAFRNFLYFLLAFFFIFMFTTADSIRVYQFKWLPDWGIKWYEKSMETKAEAFSYITSVPFLLSLLLLVNFPVQILFSAAWVSCIADAAASVIGKSYGHHKMTNFGFYPHKSFEGLIAGAMAAFFGVILIFNWYPMPGISNLYGIIFGILAAGAFVYVDAFSRFIVDNILNTLVPAALILTTIWLFI